MPKLTKTSVDSVAAPDKGDLFVWDSELQGFGIRVQASGRKTYVMRYRTRDASRTQRKLTIARCSDMPPDKARDQARKLFALVAEGHDPAADRKPEVAKTNDKTIERMFEGYVASMRAKNRTSATEVERALLKAKDNAADALGRTRPAADITPTDIVNYVSRFFLAGHRGAANKHRGYISSAYAWAMRSANDYTVPVAQRVDYGVKANPADAVAKDTGATKTRDRNLDAQEIFQLWHAVTGDGFWLETAACIRMLICCGQRVQETLRIDGAEIDLDAALWKMPAHKTKGKKRPHTIPLPPQAVETLRPLVEKHGDGPLFPSRTGAKGELMDHQSIMQAIDRWLESDSVEMER